ncbi:hypothetical protein [Palleronia aestuarii]|uniref:hypothetical protein n=1 Tax=Palleronia aestuarii TaxID=568105 RepID=UPI001F2BFA8B|nr:hypothetical protein [Palleronia aestuarii]
MLDEAATLPEDPDDLRSLAERLIAEVKAQAVLIEKLCHQLACAIVSRTDGETSASPGAPVRRLGRDGRSVAAGAGERDLVRHWFKNNGRASSLRRR